MIWPDPDHDPNHDETDLAHGLVFAVPIGILLWLLILLAFNSCAPQTPSTACPPLTDIPAKTLTQAAEELRTPPPKPALSEIVSDWIQTRDKLRLCR